MDRVEFEYAFYLKLGRAGIWEEDSLRTGKARIGWANIPLSDILQEKWEAILEKERQDVPSGAATHDFNSLKIFSEAGPDTIWVTFHQSKLWWGFLAGPVQEDDTSKYRDLEGGWRCTDVHGKHLLVGGIGGRLASLQAYRATSCQVHALEALRRLLNAESSPEYRAVEQARRSLAAGVAQGIRGLHWKDFEILVDLIFRQAGWRRTSVLGETMKFTDLELEESITGDKYQVQIKSRATLADLEEYRGEFASESFRKLYFVVHTPDAALYGFTPSCDDQVELVLVDRLAEMVIDGGLVGWLMDRTK